MRSSLIAGVFASLALTASTVFAAPIPETNTRPITIGNTTDPATPCWAGGPANCQLQTIMNFLQPGAFNVNTDQSTAGIWHITGAVPVAAPTLLVEVTGLPNSSFGIWTDLDNDTATGGDLTRVQIFNAAATGVNNGGPTIATVLFNPLLNTVSINGGAPQGGISANNFGFYLQLATGQIYYSSDLLNPSSAPMMLAYHLAAPNRWYLAWEDIQRNALCANVSSDCDHNDMIVSIESIERGRVPEAGTLALLGAALVALGLARRRKR